MQTYIIFMILFMNIDVLYLQLSFPLKLIISQYLNVERKVEEERKNTQELRVRPASDESLATEATRQWGAASATGLLLLLQDSMITSPSEGPVEEEGEDHVEEIVVGDVEDENNEVASKVSVSMKNHSLVVEVEGAPNMPESPIITENGKTHHLTEVREWPG